MSIIIAVPIAALLLFWLIKSVKNFDAKDMGGVLVPVQGLITCFGKPVRARGPGGPYFVIWGFEKVKYFPTLQYKFDYITENIHTKETKKKRTSQLKVEFSLYLRWALVGETYKIKNPETREVEEVKGVELLKQSYLTFGGDSFDPEQLKEYLEGAAGPGLRSVMVKKDHQQCREDKSEIEKEVKEYWLEEEGNPFYEAGLPPRYLSIEIGPIEFPEAMEKAFYAEEVAEKQKGAKKKIIEAFTEKGVNPAVAGILSQGIEKGKPIDFQELRDMALCFRLLGIEAGEIDIQKLLARGKPEEAKKNKK